MKVLTNLISYGWILGLQLDISIIIWFFLSPTESPAAAAGGSSSSSLGTPGGGSGGNIIRPSPGSNQNSLDRRSPAPNGPPPVAPKSTTPHSHHSHVTQHHGNTSKLYKNETSVSANYYNK